MISPSRFAEILEAAAVRARAELVVPTEALMIELAEEAKSYIGHYQQGWAPLAESTVAEKTKLGYAPPDNPLLREGDLRDSIKGDAEPMPGGARGVVGSDDEVAVYQELGTSRIPPRPFLAPAMMHSQPQAEVTFGEFAVKILSET